jgi:SH3 domain-containing YSC84-like protein 1
VKRHIAILLAAVAACCWPAAETRAQWREERTVLAATSVLSEVLGNPDSGIPQTMLRDAHGLVIVPDLLKGGFVVGLRHGNGVVLVRDERGGWQAPAFVSLTGGSVGWQIGVQATDVVLVFKTPKSVRGLLNGKFTIGADAAAAAGPVGRQAAAATDARLGAEIYSYSRSRGLFAGVSLDGSALQVDAAATQTYYQSAVLAPGTVPLVPGTQFPASAARLIEQVALYTGTAAAAPEQIARPVALSPLDSPPRATSEAVTHQQLTDAWQRLEPLLDEHWKRYLAVPHQTVAAPDPAEIEALRAAMGRYDAVASDPRYAMLARRPEFQTAHRLLRGYLKMQPAELVLPPPPKPGEPGRF